MATIINAGRVAMVPKGEWSASTAYVRLDVVQYNGSSYVAIQDSTGQNPSTATTYWQLLASGVDPSNYYTKTETDTKLGGKQDALVSGQNIKTVNGNTLLGSGDVTIADGEDGKSAYQSYVDTTTDSPVKTEAQWIASLKGEDGVGFASASSPATADGTWQITLTNGDTITIDLNHTHPSYSRKKTVTNTSDATVTLDADVIYDLGTVVGNKTINLPSTVDAGAEYEFRLAYTSGTISGTAISGTTVANNATLAFTADKTYQVIISGGILFFSETTISS